MGITDESSDLVYEVLDRCSAFCGFQRIVSLAVAKIPAFWFEEGRYLQKRIIVIVIYVRYSVRNETNHGRFSFYGETFRSGLYPTSFPLYRNHCLLRASYVFPHKAILTKINIIMELFGESRNVCKRLIMIALLLVHIEPLTSLLFQNKL